MTRIKVEDLDEDTRAKLGLSDDGMDGAVSGRLVKLGRVLGLLKGFTVSDAVWILSQALFAIQKEVSDKSEKVSVVEEAPPMGFVIYTVAKAFGVEISDLLERSRRPEIVEARHTAFFLLWNSEQYTLTEIGEAFGGRSAATVSYGYQQVVSRLPVNSRLQKTVERIKATIQRGESADVSYLLTSVNTPKGV